METAAGRERVIGDVNRFAMAIGPVDPAHPSMRIVRLYVAGRDITQADPTAYVPQFATALHREAEALKRKIDYARYEPFFVDDSVEQAHGRLMADDGELFSACRVLDLGATTDASLSFLIPCRGRLYLTSAPVDESAATPPVPAMTEITPYELIRVMEAAGEGLRSL